MSDRAAWLLGGLLGAAIVAHGVLEVLAPHLAA